MKKIIKSILNTLVNLVEFILGVALLTGSLAISGVMLITTFIVYVPLETISDVINGDSLNSAFADNVVIFFESLREFANEVFEAIEL